MTEPRLGHAVRRAKNGAAAIVVVGAGAVAAVAAVAGLKPWVSIAAAVATVLGGGRVLVGDLIVPLRMDEVESATALIQANEGKSSLDRFGTAFHVGGGQWITAGDVFGSRWSAQYAKRAQLRVRGRTFDAEVIDVDTDLNLVVVETAERWPWRARAIAATPGSGDRLKVVGWAPPAPGQGKHARRISLELTAQGMLDNGVLLATGPLPPNGFDGAPVVDLRTGRVVGFIDDRKGGESAALSETHIRLACEWMNYGKARPASRCPRCGEARCGVTG